MMVIRFLTLVLLTAVGAAACTPIASPTRAASGEPVLAASVHGLPSAVNRDLAALRRATAAFQDFARAENAGYGVQFPEGCMESAEGSQGFHYFNEGLVGTLDPTRPQLLMYEPQANGRLNLIGVEFIYPGGPTDTPPRLFEEDFVWSEVYEVWLLHVWVWRGNPDPERGIFANWNRLVSCRHASAEATVAARHHH